MEMKKQLQRQFQMWRLINDTERLETVSLFLMEEDINEIG